MLIVPIYAVHHHASLWSNPETFDPDRFSPEAAKARHRYAYIPFGAGPRVCIGNAFAVMEAATSLRCSRRRSGSPPPSPIHQNPS
ncbi:cytochrome P450 [Rhizobium sophorae]|uniref:cytochrome P450 n=1 Tax=Rhizobium sophorae TaxID=1535242 RepID=UPI0035E416E5